MIAFKSLLFTSTLLLAFGQANSAPKVSLHEALGLAERYVVENNIENKQRFLQSVIWTETFEQPEKNCWVVSWAFDAPDMIVTDGQLVVWVCADGDIRHQDSWA